MGKKSPRTVPSTLLKRHDPYRSVGTVIDRDFDDNADFVDDLTNEVTHTGTVGGHALSDIAIDLP